MKNIFLISPVRNATSEQYQQVKAYVECLEQKGYSVHWPIRDTNQTRPEDIICGQNRAAILNANEIHIWFDETSTGSIFDLGMAWAANKKLVLANKVEPTKTKSFKNLVLLWNN